MNCVFQLNTYQIENISVARNVEFSRELAAHTGDISVSINIAPNTKDPCKYRLILDIQIKPTTNKEKCFFPYHVAVRGRAFFTFKDACSRPEADAVLRLNGAAILYGLLRAQVAQITAQSVHGQFLLPAMNFVEMAKEQPANAPTLPAASTTLEHSPREVREQPASYGTKRHKSRAPNEKKRG